MKEYSPPQIRNVGLFSHGGAGKTTLSEAMLFRAGAITRMGSIEDGNTTTDFDPDELRRQMSVSLAVAPLEWQGHKVNLLDTPGYADFYGEVAEAVRVADGALILIDGVAGPQVGTDAVWKRTAQLPRLIVINKLDRENADYRAIAGQPARAVRQGRGAAHVPDWQGRRLEWRRRPAGGQGVPQRTDQRPSDPPAAEQGTIDQLREMLVESACELDDDLINKYLEGEEMTTEELVGGRAQGRARAEAVPGTGHRGRPVDRPGPVAERHRPAVAVACRRRRSSSARASRSTSTTNSRRWSSRPSPTRTSGG